MTDRFPEARLRQLIDVIEAFQQAWQAQRLWINGGNGGGPGYARILRILKSRKADVLAFDLDGIRAEAPKDWSREVEIKPGRLSVSGPDAEGDFEIVLGGEHYTYLTRTQADALIHVLRRHRVDAQAHALEQENR